MPRPFKCRRVCCDPTADYFKPRGIPVSELQQVCLALDELEAIRLADIDGMYQEEGGKNDEDIKTDVRKYHRIGT